MFGGTTFDCCCCGAVGVEGSLEEPLHPFVELLQYNHLNSDRCGLKWPSNLATARNSKQVLGLGLHPFCSFFSEKHVRFVLS